MKKFAQTLRLGLLLAALAVAGLALAPSDATAERSCFYYCGQPGAMLCANAPAKLGCTQGYLPP